MSEEQSIDDLLRLLKESVASEDVTEDSRKKGRGRKKSDSQEASAEDAYAIDPDFFNDVQLEIEKDRQNSVTEDEELAPWEERSKEEAELPAKEESELPEEPEEEEEEFSVEEEADLPEEEEEAPPVEEEPFAEEVEEEASVEETLLPFEGEDPLSTEEEDAFSEENDYRELDAFLAEISDYFTTEESGEHSVEELQAELAEELLTDEEQAFIPPEETLESLPLENLMDVFDEEETEILEERTNTEPELSDALLGLMEQLGCEDEIPELLRKTTEEEPVEDSQKRIDLKEEYLDRKKRDKKFLLRVIGVSVITVLLLLFDAIPFGEAELSGLLDFVEFPGAYLLVGLQLLVFGAAFLWRPLFHGAKKLFKGSPDLYSALFVMLAFVVLYDVTLAIFMPETILPSMFHFVSSLIMLCVFLTEYLMHRRKLHLLEIMCSEDARYTLIPSDGNQSLAEKMYRGGMNRDQRIYLPAMVSSGVEFDVDSEEISVHTRFLRGAMLPISLLVIATAVVGMAFEKSIADACAAAMIMLFVTLPLTSVAAAAIPLWTSAAWMRKRGSALGDITSMETYAECNVIVFRDLHLFRLCRMEDTGIVFYDKTNATAVMAALEILYSHVGGPMKEIFERVPEAYRAKSIRIHRIGVGGVEAFVDRKSVLLVGNYDFMKQYGLLFQRSEDPSDRTTLYVSLDGRLSAKVNARYEIDPLFEMLVDRLATEGIHCVVETYDPLIHSEFVSAMRRADAAPISVVHKNAVDLYYQQTEGESSVQKASMVSTLSRLKLAEALVWCRRIVKVMRRTEMMSFVFSGIGLLGTMLLFGFGILPSIHEYWIALYGLLPVLFVIGVVQFSFPKRLYFSERAYADELTARDERRERAQEKKRERAMQKKKTKNEKIGRENKTHE